MDESAADGVAAVDAEGAGTFATVVDALRAWEPGRGDSLAVSGQARAFLDAELNDADASPWERDVVERHHGSAGADLSVNGEIGVTFVDNVTPTTAGDLRVAIALLADRYNFVVVYWLDDAPAAADSRRSVRRSVSADHLDVAGLEFVGSGTNATVGRSAVADLIATVLALGHLVVPALLLVVGVGVVGWSVAVTVGLGRVLLVGVAGLFAGSLALATFLAWQ